MPERTCPKCGVAVDPRLKFCRECGGRMDDGGGSPPAPVVGSGEDTVLGALPTPPPSAGGPPKTVRAGPDGAGPGPAAPATRKVVEEPELDEVTMRASGAFDADMTIAPEEAEANARSAAKGDGAAGDETMLSGIFDLPKEAEPLTVAADAGIAPTPSAKGSGKGKRPRPPESPEAAPAPSPPPEPATLRADPAPAPPPAPEPEPATMQADPGPAAAPKTTPAPKPATPPAAAPEPAPPPPPPPPAPEPEPVTDDFASGDDESGETLAQALPPPVLESPPGPRVPPPPPQRAEPEEPPTLIGPPPAPFRAGAPREPIPTPRIPVRSPAPAGAGPAGGTRLEHWSPKVKSDIVVLESADVVVGRDRGDIQYPEDSYLSKKHARFFRDPAGTLCVEDLGTLNGTFLRLRAPVRLEHRDVLFLGRHCFRFELLQYEEKDDRTLEGDPLTRVLGAQGKAPRARIVKRQDEGFRGLPFFFGTLRYVLGRTDGTHNFRKDDLMSRRHAALYFKEGDYWLEDLGSQNGTFLRIRGPRPLESGDVVKMGDQYFKVG